jgi:protein involved in polysaccharide export with SLBB domain
VQSLGQAPDSTTREGRRVAAQDRPSEFQKHVERSTGTRLPVFGAQFFAEAADTFAPVDNVPVGADYLVSAGDEIFVRVWGSIDVDYRTTVDRNGLINLPKVGSFTVAGIKASALEAHLRAQIGRLFTNFNLNVSLGQLRGVKVFVVGSAIKPGVYNLASQATLLSAVVAAGGPATNGSMRKVSLRRDNRVVSELDVYEFLVQGDKSKDIQLAAGDVVVFHAAGPRVALTGTTDAAAIYELKTAQEPMQELLRYAGGASVLANRLRVHVERIDPLQIGAKRTVEEFQLDESGLLKPLRDGDVVTLLAISPEFSNAVTLKGHVAQPLRSAWRPGMRIRDLIPDKEALVTPSFHRRKNRLVQLPDVEPDRSAPAVKTAPASLFDELNWDYAVVERLNTADLSPQVIPFNLGRAVLGGDARDNIELMAGDVVTVYSHKDIRVPVAKQTRLVTLQGEVAAPGVYQLQPGETLRGLIKRAGGFTDQAYIYGLDFSREETRQRQRENLATATGRLEALASTQAARSAANRRDESSASGEAAVSSAATQAQISRLSKIDPNGRIALELEPTIATLDGVPDLPLENGDRISVPTRPGFVTVIGAVVNNNAFLWKAGRTAGDYVKLAGLDEAAEVSNMFILRADGTVSHAGDSRSFFGVGGGLQSSALSPGDAVIVPHQLDFETWGRALVRNLKDWSQILTGFGLGAAGIKSLQN